MSSTIDQIRVLGDRWAAAEVDGDADTLAGVITADFKLVGPYGFILDRPQWIERYHTGDLVTTKLSWHDVDIRDYGDAAVAVGTQTQEAAYRGNPNNGDFRTTHVFVHQNGAWWIAGIHLSITTPPAPPGPPPPPAS